MMAKLASIFLCLAAVLLPLPDALAQGDREYRLQIIGNKDLATLLSAIDELDRGESFEAVARRHSSNAEESLRTFWVSLHPSLPPELVSAVAQLHAGAHSRMPVQQEGNWLLFRAVEVRGALQKRMEAQKRLDERVDVLIGENRRGLTSEDIDWLTRQINEVVVNPLAHDEAFCGESMGRDLRPIDSAERAKAVRDRAARAEACMTAYAHEISALPGSLLGRHHRINWSSARVADFDLTWTLIKQARQMQTVRLQKQAAVYRQELQDALDASEE